MRKAFTFIELVFVIVVMGILAKFGTNILVTTYNSYTQSTNNNKLLANTESTLKLISNRLQYRIRDSVITRTAPNAGVITSLSAVGVNSRVLEWISYDIDGWLGNALSTNPNWSGFVDVANTAAFGAKTYIESPMTNTANINGTITALRANGSGTSMTNAAIFFTGANSDINSSYGWAGIALGGQNNIAAHRVQAGATATQLAATVGTFAGTDIYENYKLAWTAYALSLEDFDGDGGSDLVLYYDFQPWEGDPIPTGNVNKRQLLLQNVDTFTFRGMGDSIMIQICTNDADALGAGDGGYSVCEETSIF